MEQLIFCCLLLDFRFRQPGLVRPVLLHGPRSLTCLQFLWVLSQHGYVRLQPRREEERRWDRDRGRHKPEERFHMVFSCCASRSCFKHMLQKFVLTGGAKHWKMCLKRRQAQLAARTISGAPPDVPEETRRQRGAYAYHI